MKTDIEIAQECKMLPIGDICKKLNINPKYIENYGNYKAKIDHRLLNNMEDRKDAKVILVTAINPTPAGEGKTTTTIGLGDALNKLGKKTFIAIREPSLGPCMGIKGGAAGGGYSQVVPMEDINLHFTGDIHAVSIANNLIATVLDNSIHHKNILNIDQKKITWKRCVDMNDRALRNIIINLGCSSYGNPREDGFLISVASEVMAVLCLSTDLEDLKKNIGNITVAKTFDNKPVTVNDLKIAGAVTALLKQAFNPNLVQTLEGNPAFVHGGPFANIAHGCNSLIATKLAMKLSDYVVTEAGFGADLGAEKFFNIKCRKGNIKPSAAVIVATIRALKHHGLHATNPVTEGFKNLKKHIENLNKFNIPVVVNLNLFTDDTKEEIDSFISICNKNQIDYSISKNWEKGADGALDLAEIVLKKCDNTTSDFNLLYENNLSLKDKIEKICKEIYGAYSVIYSSTARRTLKSLEEHGYSNHPICMAKTQYSFSDKKNLIGVPDNFRISINNIILSSGAGFIVAICGDIMTMPGLPKIPSAENIDIDKNGNISGLF